MTNIFPLEIQPVYNAGEQKYQWRLEPKLTPGLLIRSAYQLRHGAMLSM